MDQVAIVIPLYKTHPSEQELFAISNNLGILNDYPKFVIAPVGFVSDEYKGTLKSAKILYLAPYWFKNLNSYNKLMMDKSFYELFINYEYILIIQPDALVFNDEIIEWCNKGYSYIGAPWPQGKLISPYSFRGHGLIRKFLPFFNVPQKCYVGNGGLSLRNVNQSLLILKEHCFTVKLWSSQEDYFWAYYFELSNSIPSELIASKFSLELNADLYYNANGCVLPFGCHAFEKYDFDFLKMKFNFERNHKKILR